jgi:hypothetical protein
MNNARIRKATLALSPVGAALLALTVLARSSAAQVPAQAPPDADAKAVELSVAGKHAFDAKKYAEAYDAFKQVWTLKKTVTTAANLAMVELKLGKMRDAAEHFQFALRHFPAGPDAEKSRAVAQKRLDEAKAHIGTLVLGVSVAGAEVYVDGALVGTAPLDEIFLEPGQRLLEVSHPGYKAARKALSFAAGSTERVQLILQPISTAPAMQPGSGSLPAAKASPQPSQGPQPPPDGSKVPWNHIAIGAGGVTGVALLLTGAVFAVWSNDTADAADRVFAKLDEAGSGSTACSVPGQNAADCEQLATLRAEQSRTANVALGTLLAGGTVAAAMVVYGAVLVSKQRPAPAVQALPLAGPHTAGLVVRGQW